MTAQDAHLLALYNSEVARGILHTSAWERKMVDLQITWNAEQNAINGRPATDYSPKSPFFSLKDL